MSLEQDLKETFMRHAEDVRPDTQSWPVVEKKVRRSHAARATAVSACAIAAIAAAAILLPKIGNHAAPHGFVGPSGSASVQPGLKASDHYYNNNTSNWEIHYPQAWQSEVNGDVTVFQPPGFPNMHQDSPHFAVQIQELEGDYRSNFPIAKEATLISSGSARISGLPTKRLELQSTTGLHEMSYQVDWTGKCGPSLNCSNAGVKGVLIINVWSTSANLWDQYRIIGLQVAQSLLYTPSAAQSTVVNTAHGFYPVSITDDALTQVLVRFLEARVQGTGAAAFMSAQAQHDFATGSNCSYLYRSGTSNQKWAGYEIMFRFDTNGQTTFTLAMNTGPGQGGFLEDLAVGRVAGVAKILRGNTSCSLAGD